MAETSSKSTERAALHRILKGYMFTREEALVKARDAIMERCFPVIEGMFDFYQPDCPNGRNYYEASAEEFLGLCAAGTTRFSRKSPENGAMDGDAQSYFGNRHFEFT